MKKLILGFIFTMGCICLCMNTETHAAEITTGEIDIEQTYSYDELSKNASRVESLSTETTNLYYGLMTVDSNEVKVEIVVTVRFDYNDGNNVTILDVSRYVTCSGGYRYLDISSGRGIVNNGTYAFFENDIQINSPNGNIYTYRIMVTCDYYGDADINVYRID